MTEEQAGYAVGVSVEELTEAVARIITVELPRVDRIEQRLADGDLTAPLAGSLVLVELRRIADALATLAARREATDAITVLEAEVAL